MPSWPCHEGCLDCIPSWSTCQACLRKCALGKLMPVLLELFHSLVINWCFPQDRFGFWIPSRGFRTPGTRFHIFVSGTWIPDSCSSVFRIPKPRIVDSTSKNFPDSEIRIDLHTWGNDVKRRLHRCHVCTINPLDKRSNVCIVNILRSKLDKTILVSLPQC